MQQNTILIRRLSSLFYNVLKTFIFLNGMMIAMAVYNIFTSNIGSLRTSFWIFCMITINFWVMIMFFFLVSACIKICILVVASLSQDNTELLGQLFPLSIPIGQDEDELETVLNESLNTSPPSRTSPTLDKLLKAELKWGFSMKPETTPYSNDEKCLICANNLDYNFPGIVGCVSLSCSCDTIFHKKCLLEWFHFNETERTDTEPSMVTCPSCRHAFTESIN